MEQFVQTSLKQARCETPNNGSHSWPRLEVTHYTSDKYLFKFKYSRLYLFTRLKQQ